MMKWFLTSVFCFLVGENLVAQEAFYAGARAESFITVPKEVRPWCYYWILKGNITDTQITHDLEAMAEKGFGGVLVFDSRFYYDAFDSKEHVPVPLTIRHEFMSESWQARILHLIREAARLGMRVSLNISNSGGVLRGPWDLEADGPKEVLWTEGDFPCGTKLSLELSSPKGKRYYTDLAFLAVRLEGAIGEPKQWADAWNSVVEFTDSAARVAEVVDLRPFVTDGTLRWTVPAGEGTWRLLRLGWHVVGDFGAVDILSEAAVKRYFQLFADPLLKKAGPLAGKTLTHFYNVSWEGSNPNWTPDFPAFFQARNGYAVDTFLPVLCGYTVQDTTVSRQFLTDYYRAISDAFREHCYANIGRMCHERGIVWHSEDGGPWRRNAPIFREADMLSFWGQNDVPQGEFWVQEEQNGNRSKPESFTNSNMRYAAMAAHLYGRRLVAAEAFTHMQRHWTMFPAHLKRVADISFIDGANWLIWHTFTASLPEWGEPGFEYFAGSHVNTHVTWFPYLEGFLTYLGRCQYLLRQGDFVADLCVYESKKNYVMWGHGETWNTRAGKKLPKGYTFDLLDTPSLEKLEWQDGFWVLPSGMRYRVLVIEPQAKKNVSSKVLQKIEQQRLSGAIVVDGAGDKTLETVLPTILPDFEGPFAYHHRHTDQQDIYFLRGEGSGECTFRVTEQTPTLWNAVTGEIEAVDFTRTEDGRTRLTVKLPEDGSLFVVFGAAVEPTQKGVQKGAQAGTKTGEKTVDLSTGWTLQLDPKGGGPAEAISLPTLWDWTESADSRVRYYSGTGVYTRTFTAGEINGAARWVLRLGQVRHIARVWLNGQDLGVVWCPPWEIDVTQAIQPGENRLQIDVANVWANRLIGDAQLPAEQRITRSNMYFYEKPGDIPAGGTRPYSPWQGFHKQDSLSPSGLLGPVTLQVLSLEKP